MSWWLGETWKPACLTRLKFMRLKCVSAVFTIEESSKLALVPRRLASVSSVTLSVPTVMEELDAVDGGWYS